jgi:hypothetical protein
MDETTKKKAIVAFAMAAFCLGLVIYFLKLAI